MQSTGGFACLKTGIAKSEDWNKSLPGGPDHCGYWAFIPIVREVCGTRVISRTCDGKNQESIPSVCGRELQILLDPLSGVKQCD